jgi:hypothetical protein
MNKPRVGCYVYRLWWKQHHTFLLHSVKLTEKQFIEKVAKVVRKLESNIHWGSKDRFRNFVDFSDIERELIKTEGFGTFYVELDREISMNDIFEHIDKVNKQSEAKIEH